VFANGSPTKWQSSVQTLFSLFCNYKIINFNEGPNALSIPLNVSLFVPKRIFSLTKFSKSWPKPKWNIRLMLYYLGKKELALLVIFMERQ
jgi:hypothetical protein